MSALPTSPTVECPECGGTGRVPQRSGCEWCREAAAEDACDECDRPLCRDCLHEGRCLECIPNDELDEMLAEVA